MTFFSKISISKQTQYNFNSRNCKMFDEEESFNGIKNENDNNDSVTEEGDINYYHMLNLPKNATTDDINRAYKQRSLIFHPDRHIDEEDKREAAKIFLTIKEAHEVLTNPKTRPIYDILGVKGVKLQGWELSTHSTTAENIRKEYEFLKRLNENEIEFQRINPETNFIVRSSIAGLFRKNSLERFKLLGMISGMNVYCPLTVVDRIGCNGRISIGARGSGNCSVQCSWKRALSNSSHFEPTLQMSPNHIIYSAKFSHIFFPDSNKWHWLQTILYEPAIKYNFDGRIEYSLIPTFIFQLSPNNEGAINLNLMGNNPTMTVTLIHNELNKPKYIFAFSFSQFFYSLRLTYHLRYPKNAQHFQANFSLSSPLTCQSSITMERNLTKYSKIGMKIQFIWPTFFLQASFRIRTSLNNYEFRMVFCEHADQFYPTEFIPAALCLALPILAIRTTWPIIRKKFPNLMRMFGGGENIKDEMGIEMKREQAQKAVNLMREMAERSAIEEEEKGGLVILDAKFGQMLDERPGWEHYPMMTGEKLIDVSIPLQAMINDLQLRIYCGKDLPGFYDPCPGEPKMLKVVYRFQNRLHSATAIEDQLLVIPNKEHMIDDNFQ